MPPARPTTFRPWSHSPMNGCLTILQTIARAVKRREYIGSAIAGAAHLLDRDIAGFMEFTGCSLAETLPLYTTNPARLLGVLESGNKIEINAPANLVLFNYRQGSQRLEMIKTWRNGRLVFEAPNG